MKYVPSIITVLLLLWRLPVSLGEAGIAWDILNQEAQELQDKGQYGRAVIVAKKARERAEKDVGPRQPDVSGRLSVIWGDPPASSQAQPTMDWFLTDNQGKVTALDLGQDLIRQHGGWRALNTKRVTIETGFVDGGSDRVMVESLTLDRSADLTTVFSALTEVELEPIDCSLEGSLLSTGSGEATTIDFKKFRVT